MATGSQLCYIIPPHVLRAIASSQAASKSSVDLANKTLARIALVREARIQASVTADPPNPQRRAIVPSYVFETIARSDSASEEAKDRARKYLSGMSDVRDAKVLQTTLGSPATHLFRVLYDSLQTNQHGNRLFFEGQIPQNPDPYAMQVYNNFGNTFKFYSEILNRNSIDDNGMHLIGCVHYDDDSGQTAGYDNAFWDGTQMCFGDGDPEIFNTFTESLDITGHELTHGVTAWTANLPYEYQAGALNESMSDVFGSMTKQFAQNPKQKAKEADWLIGADLFRDRHGARALRDMAHPGTAYKDNKFIGSDPQPEDMDGYVHLPNTDNGDYGGVHINSGIPNRAFFLAATGVGDYSWEPAGKIWYAALTDDALKNIQNTHNVFKVFATLTIKHAQTIGGATAVTAVKKAWATVKVL